MFPCPAGCVFSLGRKSSSSNRSSRSVLCLIVQTVVSLSLFPGSAAGAAALKLLLYIIITTSENGDRTPKNVRPQLLFGKNSSFRMSTQISRTLRFSLPLTKCRLEGDATRALKLTEAQEVRLETPPYGP